jgi:molybdopterin/thiamine biosynthesis adenylyltransferase/rhodanese-related sulfurtransferase
MSLFSEREYLRYTRHIQLPKVGSTGQTKLKRAHLLVIGCGGLGAPVSLYLAAAGVGTLTLVDGDTVDITNLQRQIIFTQDQIGQPKASCARDNLIQRNEDIEINAIDQALSPENAPELIEAADLVLDCTDNFAVRYLINDVCKSRRKPWIYASIFQFSGQCAMFVPERTCFRCLFPRPPKDIQDCNAAGVLGVLPGVLGTIQATEALKYIIGLPMAIENQLLLVETDDLSMHKIELMQDSDCLTCHSRFAFDPDRNDYRTECAMPEAEASDELIAAAEFHNIATKDDVVIIDVREADERQAFHLGGLHIPLKDLVSALDFPPDKTLILYCQSGARSLSGCQLLRKKGFTAFSVEGGIANILQSTQGHTDK